MYHCAGKKYIFLGKNTFLCTLSWSKSVLNCNATLMELGLGKGKKEETIISGEYLYRTKTKNYILMIRKWSKKGFEKR